MLPFESKPCCAYVRHKLNLGSVAGKRKVSQILGWTRFGSFTDNSRNYIIASMQFKRSLMRVRLKKAKKQRWRHMMQSGLKYSLHWPFQNSATLLCLAFWPLSHSIIQSLLFHRKMDHSLWNATPTMPLSTRHSHNQLSRNAMSQPTQKPRVLLVGVIDFAHEEWEALKDVATLEVSTVSSIHLK